MLTTLYLKIIKIESTHDYTHIQYSHAFGTNTTIWDGWYRKPLNESLASTLKINHCYQIKQIRKLVNDKPTYEWLTATEIRTKKKAEPVSESDSARLSLLTSNYAVFI